MTGGNEGRPEKWLEQAEARLDRVALGPRAEEIGRVEEVGDGVVRISGLPNVRLDEVLQFDKGLFGFVHSLDEDCVHGVLIDPAATIEAGDAARGLGDVVRTPVGPGLLGRVVDPLGRPLDGKGPVAGERFDPAERPAPAIIDRDLVTEPVQTGVLVIDTLFALGRGQRELIIGDRAIGKTTLAIDTIIAQKHSDMICVYIAVGQKSSSVRRAIDAIAAHGAPERCVFVVAGSASPTGLQWIAPFAGFTIGEYFRDRGGHALVIIDDLSKHAATHRELALLTREPPGREAFPGDIFYVHARLLERAAKLSTALGGGSLTALPVAETDAGNLSAYIPTNLISITDGQIVLDSRLFAANQRPAVDVGLSVSRVGGKAQAPALRAAAGRLRLDYSQFLELEMFTRFGGIADKRVRATIARGERIRAALAQPRFATLRLVDQVALLSALSEGVFDSAPAAKVGEARARVAAQLDALAPEAVAAVMTTGTCDDGERAKLVEAVRALVQAADPS